MQPLAILFFLILVELAVGGFLVVVMVDFGGIATKGFLGLAGVTYLATGAVAWWARGFISPPPSGAGVGYDPTWRDLEGLSFLLFLAGLAIYTFFMLGGDDAWRRRLASVTLASGLVTLLASGLAYRVPHGGGFSTIVSILTGGIVVGSAMSGMILGHWYLVTPGLSARPLRDMTVVLFGTLLLQAALIPIWLVSIAPNTFPDATAMIAGIYGIPFWLRVLVGIVLPLIVAGMTWHCCRIRSLQSATGLLYVAVALVLAGEIAAKLLLVLTRVPV